MVKGHDNLVSEPSIPMVPRVETSMSAAEQERCKVMLDKLLARMDEQGRKMDDMISSLAATTSRLLGAAADSTPISTATNKVLAVANAAPSADATLTDQAHIRCSRSGLDTNADDLHVVATFNPKTGVSMVAPAPVEHSSTPSSKPFSIKHDTQELLVIDDLLSALVGIEGRYISIKRIRGKEGYVVFQIDSSVDLALQELTRRIFPLCEDFVLVSHFVESRSHFKNGLVNHALAAALRAFLLDYQAMVAQLEHQFRLGRLSVQGLWFFCQRMMSSLNALAVLVEKAISNNTSGSVTLYLIQSQAKAMAGDNVVRSLLEKMTECASAAYLRMLERWVYEGVIDDPYGEFFITENKSVQKESLTQDYDAKYWQQRYSLKEGIPSFLTNVAATILATGKYLHVMRECGHNVQVFLSENSKLMSFGSNHQYLDCIKSVYDFASGVDQVSSSHLRFSCYKFSGFLANNVEGIMSTLMVFLLAKELQMPWDPGDANLNNMDSRCFAIVKSRAKGGSLTTRQCEMCVECSKGTLHFLSFEQRRNPALRGQPTVVVQYNNWKGGDLIAVSYEARKFGVKRSMRGDEAKNVCPSIKLVQVPVSRDKTDLNIYRNAGSEVVAILATKGKCEQASIDEVSLDLTDAAKEMLLESSPESPELVFEEATKSNILGLPSDVSDREKNVSAWLCRADADYQDKLLACGAIMVAHLRIKVLEETQFTCFAGIAHNKMLAKLVSGVNKPAQQTVVPSSSVQDFLASLPVQKMKQLGGKLGSSLQDDLWIETFGDLLSFTEDKLQEYYGVNTGTWL